MACLQKRHGSQTRHLALCKGEDMDRNAGCPVVSRRPEMRERLEHDHRRVLGSKKAEQPCTEIRSVELEKGCSC